MALDLVAVLALFAFAWLGAHRGGAESGIRFAGLAFAYGSAYGASRFAGAPLATALGVAPWIGLASAGLIGFFAARTISGCPLVMPASKPPALFVGRT